MRWGLTALEVILIGLIAYILVRAVITFTNPESRWAPVSAGPANFDRPVSGGTTAVDLTFDPFHRTETIVLDLPPDVGEDAPETSLNLTMVGRTVPLTAILQTPDGQQKVYKVGDEILNGVTLESVTARYIVLSQGGRLERLTFDDNESTGLKAAAGTSPATGGPITPQYLLSAISLTPVVENGESQGLRIAARRPELDLTTFGLAPGDVLTHIGSTDLRSGRPNLTRLMSEFSGAGGTQVKLLRNGQAITVELKL